MNKKFLTLSSYLYLVSYAFTVTTIGPCNAPISKEFHIGAQFMGLLISTHFFGMLFSVFLSGYLIDRAGLKPVMMSGSALLGLSLIGFGFSGSAASLFVMFFFAGIGGGAVEVAVNALISKLYSDSRVPALNMLHLCFGIGAFVWPMVAGTLLHGGVSWRTLYLMIGLYSLSTAALLGIQKFPAGKPEEKIARLKDMAAMLRNPTVLLLGGVMFFYVGGEMGINSWIVRYFDDVLFQGSPPASGISINLGFRTFDTVLSGSFFLTVFWLAMTVGRVFSVFAGRVMSDTALLRVCVLVSTVAGIATFMCKSYILAAVFLAVTGLFFSGIFATTIAVSGNRFPASPGIISGIVMGFSCLGNVVLNTGIGYVAQSAGLRTAMLIAALLLVIMTVCAFLIGEAGSGKQIIGAPLDDLPRKR